jgi:hypothetical protein
MFGLYIRMMSYLLPKIESVCMQLHTKAYATAYTLQFGNVCSYLSMYATAYKLHTR